MAPPPNAFPLSELEDKINYHTVDFKEKRRKNKDWDLETCELLELVQYSCTSMRQQMEASKVTGGTRMECVPFVRLYRRCGKGEKMFHVETTAWEGEHAYEAPTSTAGSTITQDVARKEKPSMFAEYGNFFWSTEKKGSGVSST